VRAYGVKDSQVSLILWRLNYLKQRIRGAAETVTPDVLSGVTEIGVMEVCEQNYVSAY
jgi:hypothetical protein